MYGYVILHMVCNVDDDSVSFTGIDGRPREPPINCDNGLSMAQSAQVLKYNLRPKEYVRGRSRKVDERVYWYNKRKYSHQTDRILWQLRQVVT